MTVIVCTKLSPSYKDYSPVKWIGVTACAVTVATHIIDRYIEGKKIPTDPLEKANGRIADLQNRNAELERSYKLQPAQGQSGDQRQSGNKPKTE